MAAVGWASKCTTQPVEGNGTRYVFVIVSPSLDDGDLSFIWDEEKVRLKQSVGVRDTEANSEGFPSLQAHLRSVSNTLTDVCNEGHQTWKQARVHAALSHPQTLGKSRR